MPLPCARSVLVGVCLLVLRDPALTNAQRNLATVMALMRPGNGMIAAERVVALRDRVAYGNDPHGIHLLIVLQDRHQVEAAGYSRAEADALLAMCDDTCLLRVNDIDTAGMVSRRLSCYTVRVEGSSTTRGRAGGTTGESVSTTRRELISPAELTQWTADTGLLLVTGEGAYAVLCPDLSERFEQKMLGMGTREENLAIRRKVALTREPRNVTTPPIWDGDDVEGRHQGDGHEDVTEGFDPLA